MTVDLSMLEAQLMARIDENDLLEVEKVKRYISYVEMDRNLDADIEKDGETVITENASQKFVKSHPALAEKIRISKQLIAIEKSINFKKQAAATSSSVDDKGKRGSLI